MLDSVNSFIHNPEAILSVVMYILLFMTIYTILSPFLSGNKYASRMKYVSTERDKLREQRLKELAKRNSGGIRQNEASGFMSTTVDNLKLEKVLGADKLSSSLRMAGLRGSAPKVTFLFFRMVMPILLGLLTLGYLFYVNDFGKPVHIRLLIAFAAAIAGFYLPNIIIQNMIQKRQQSMMQAFPDSLDLLLICVQSGMSAEAAFGKVSHEIGKQSIELAEEYTLTTAELSYLPERSMAYENLASRTGLKPVKAVTTSLMQAEKYGTPLGQALRVLSQESREARMANAEKKAAALPPKLTVPMILFFLPVLFIVILGPAMMKISSL